MVGKNPGPHHGFIDWEFESGFQCVRRKLFASCLLSELTNVSLVDSEVSWRFPLVLWIALKRVSGGFLLEEEWIDVWKFSLLPLHPTGWCLPNGHFGRSGWFRVERCTESAVPLSLYILKCYWMRSTVASSVSATISRKSFWRVGSTFGGVLPHISRLVSWFLHVFGAGSSAICLITDLNIGRSVFNFNFLPKSGSKTGRCTSRRGKLANKLNAREESDCPLNREADFSRSSPVNRPDAVRVIPLIVMR